MTPHTHRPLHVRLRFHQSVDLHHQRTGLSIYFLLVADIVLLKKVIVPPTGPTRLAVGHLFASENANTIEALLDVLAEFLLQEMNKLVQHTMFVCQEYIATLQIERSRTAGDDKRPPVLLKKILHLPVKRQIFC